MRLRSALLALVIVPAAIAAHADTFTTYNLAATLIPSNGIGSTGSVTGTVLLDETTGMFTNSNLSAIYSASASNTGGSYSVTGGPTSMGITGTGNSYYTNFGVFGAKYFGLVLPLASLVNYGGGILCSTTSPCLGNGTVAGSSSSSGGNLGYSFGVSSGSLTAASAVTPEPSSLMLLATGALGLIGAARRRFV